MKNKETIADFQNSLGTYLRNPQNHNPPQNIEKERLTVYQDLLFHNIERILSNTFPVFKKIVSTVYWQNLVRDFFTRHQCQSPFYQEVPREFLSYLQNEKEWEETEPDYLIYLAHYEWVELDLFLSAQDEKNSSNNNNQTTQEQTILYNPVLYFLFYPYPVHLISPEFKPQQTSENFYLVYRQPSSGQVEFMVLNKVTARFVELTHTKKLNLHDTLLILSEELHQQPGDILPQIKVLQEEFYKKGVLL